MKALGAKLYDVALAGDMAATKLLLIYAIGKPPDAVDADRLDSTNGASSTPRPRWHIPSPVRGRHRPAGRRGANRETRPQDEARTRERIVAAVDGMDEAADLGEPCAMGSSSPGNGRQHSANETAPA